MELCGQDLTPQLLSSLPLHSIPHTFIEPVCFKYTLHFHSPPTSTLGWELISFPPRDTRQEALSAFLLIHLISYIRRL